MWPGTVLDERRTNLIYRSKVQCLSELIEKIVLIGNSLSVYLMKDKPRTAMRDQNTLHWFAALRVRYIGDIVWYRAILRELAV